MARDLAGQAFGRWTVVGRAEGPGPARWRCRCSCGAERDVAQRHLVSGASTSCGCLTRERAGAAKRIDLTGRRFGKLTVLERAGTSPGGAQMWKCRCDCGSECEALQSALQNGRRADCGCESKRGNTAKDVAGQRFGSLTALYPTDERARNGSVIWRCRCECGSEADVALDRLKDGSVLSCGCLREKNGREISQKLTRVAGTSIDALRSRKMRPDNHTGVRGVSMKRGRYVSGIMFQKKTYYLGSYSTLEEAAFVRKEAEALIHESAVEFYEEWKRRADGDPEWAEMNPVRICVTRRDDGDFTVEMAPKLS